MQLVLLLGSVGGGFTLPYAQQTMDDEFLTAYIFWLIVIRVCFLRVAFSFIGTNSDFFGASKDRLLNVSHPPRKSD